MNIQSPLPLYVLWPALGSSVLQLRCTGLHRPSLKEGRCTGLAPRKEGVAMELPVYSHPIEGESLFYVQEGVVHSIFMQEEQRKMVKVYKKKKRNVPFEYEGHTGID